MTNGLVVCPQATGNAAHGSVGQVATYGAALGVPCPTQGTVLGRRQLI